MSLRVLAMLLLFFLAAPGARAAEATDPPPRKKLISLGWDHPTPAQLRRDLAGMERRPFDGVVLAITARGAPPELGGQPFLHAFSPTKWQRDWFQESVRDLKSLRPKRLKENFLWLFANPGSVDWFDDEGWRNIVEHWRIAAWVARQGGLRGILFDPEPYTPPHAAFRYDAQPQRGQHSFDDYSAKARQRGREVMRAMVAEYPGITLFTLFMNSWNLPAAALEEPHRLLAAQPYGLLPAFIDGWLDVMPPSVTLVDGGEGAYLYNDELSFYRLAVEVKGIAQNLISPANRSKYRSQVQVSFGLYLDAYVNPPSSPYFIDGKGGPRIERLRENLDAALRAADEYVWLYGEKGRWWPDPAGTTPVKREVHPPWPERLPGVEQVAAFARNRKEALREQLESLRRANQLMDLARNGGFRMTAAPTLAEDTAPVWSQLPPEWVFWQSDASQGRFGWDPAVGAAKKGAVRLENTRYGCFIQNYPAKPGERFAVVVKSRHTGAAAPWVRVRWEDTQGQWTQEAKDVLIPAPPPSRGAETAWAEIADVVTVPEGAGKLVLLLGVTGQSSPAEIAWFDDVHVYRLP